MRIGYKRAILRNGFCMNSRCDKYWEDDCILAFESGGDKTIYPYTTETTIEESEKRCGHYKEGRCDWYEEENI